MNKNMSHILDKASTIYLGVVIASSLSEHYGKVFVYISGFDSWLQKDQNMCYFEVFFRSNEFWNMNTVYFSLTLRFDIC